MKTANERMEEQLREVAKAWNVPAKNVHVEFHPDPVDGSYWLVSVSVPLMTSPQIRRRSFVRLTLDEAIWEATNDAPSNLPKKPITVAS